MSETPAIEPADEEEAGCSWCERGSGAILVIGAVGLLYIGLDLISGGALSRAFVGGVRSAADAIDAEGQGGELGAEIAAVTDEPSA